MFSCDTRAKLDCCISGSAHTYASCVLVGWLTKIVHLFYRDIAVYIKAVVVVLVVLVSRFLLVLGVSLRGSLNFRTPVTSCICSLLDLFCHEIIRLE